MNIFETVKMRRLLDKRAKLETELMMLRNPAFNPWDSMLFNGGMSGERYIKIQIIRGQIQGINNQIAALLTKG